MKKEYFQSLAVIVLLFGLWFALNQVNWMRIFKVTETTTKMEQKLGEILWKAFRNADEEISNPQVKNPIDSIITHICTANHLDRKDIKVHILQNAEVNAFALPNDYLVIYSGLIQHVENQEELAGVICHELAHITLKHVMKKLIKEIGLHTLLGITTGKHGGEIIKETSRHLTATAFDRSLEKAADIQAVDYMIQSGIDPENYAHFLYKLADTELLASKYTSWISTHPESKERAAYVIEHINNSPLPKNYQPMLSISTWENMKSALDTKE
jgi:predicted Zn-dependent protease